MRIARLDLLRYGRFTDRSLPFPAGAVDLHVICGPNEAGKSTAMSAIEDFFFGFERTSSYAFVHEQSSLRVGAIVDGGGAALELRRKKGNKDTLLGPDDKPLSGDPLRAILGGVDREIFARTWSLDHVRLREGGRQILDAKDDVGRMLFEAGVGLVGLRDHLRRLDAEAEAIYAPRASSQRSFYVAQTRMKDAEKRLRDATVTTHDWLKARAALDALVAERKKLLVSLGKKKAERVRLERIRRVLPVLAELNRIESELQLLGDPATLPVDAAAVLQDAEQEQIVAERHLRQFDTQDQDAAQELERLVVDEGILSMESEIGALNDQRATVAKARSDGARRRTELSEKEQRLATLLAEIDRTPLSLGEIEALLPARPKVGKLRELLEARSGLDAAFAAADEEKKRSVDDLAELRRQEEDQPAVTDAAPLAGAAQAVRNRAELAGELRGAVRDAEKVDARIATAMAELRPFQGDAESLRALSIPNDARIEATRLRLAKIADRSRAIDAEWGKARDDLTEKRCSKRALLRTGTAVALEEVTSARQVRDRTWILVRRRHVDGLPVEDGEVREAIGPANLPDAFETTMKLADEVADRRFIGAQDSARVVDLDLRIEDEQQRCNKLAEERRGLDEAREKVLQEWTALWSKCGLSPEAPEGMAEWTKKRASALALVDERAEKGQQLAWLREEEASLRAQLLTALSSVGTSVERLGSASLVQVLAEADERLKVFAAEAAERKSLAKEMQKAMTRLAIADRNLGVTTQALADWDSTWRQAVEKAGRPPGETLADTRGALSVFDEIREVAGKARDLTDRIRRIADDAAAFDEAARRLAALLGARSENLSSDAVVEALVDELKTHRERKVRRDALSTERAKRLGERSKIDEQRVQADSQIGQLLRAANCRSVDELRLAIERARLHKEYRERREQELRRLAEAGNGAEREVLEEECEGADRDRMPAELEQLESEIDAESERLRAMDLDVAKAKDDLDKIAGGDVADAAATARQLALSEMQDEAQRYVKLRAASRLLRWAIDRYRETKQAPLLERAATLFRGVTRDAFTSLCIDLDDHDKPVLLGVRGDGSQVPVEGMSDGSVDQLYLALRLAAIDEHLAAATPLPLVADDLFINFDDARAAAGFRVLADLARRTQVLFFTHHEHLVRVASEAVGPEHLSIHEL